MKTNAILFCLGLMLKTLLVSAQTTTDALVERIENDMKAGRMEISYLPDSLSGYVCEALIYYDSSGLQKLESGCGDASIESTSEHYYFEDNKIRYVLYQHFYYNAPPTYTEEVAKKEGVTAGWFDDEKTKIEQTNFYFENGKLVKMIDQEGNNIPSTSDRFKSASIFIEGKVKEAFTHYSTMH